MSFLEGLGSALGDVGSSILSGLFGQHSANKQMDWQQWMSSTAHQRAVADLRAAGLNPILAAGSPASTPSGAMAVMPDSRAGSSFQSASSAVSSRDLMRQQLDNLKTENIKTALEGELADQHRHESMAREKNYNVNSALQVAQEAESRARVPLLSAQAKQTGEQARFTKADADVREWYALKYSALNPAVNFLIDDVLNPIFNSARDAAEGRIDVKDILQQGGLKYFKHKFNIK